MKRQGLMLHVLPSTLLALGGIAAAQTGQNTTYSYQYDANGNLTQITDPLGHVTNRSYDALNRVVQQLQPAPAPDAARPAIGYAYDGHDQLVALTDPRNLVTTYTIDGLSNVTQQQSPDTGTASKTYDAAGNLLTSTDAKGQTTTYSYDALNRISHIAYADGNAIDYTYDQGINGIGRLSQITDGSGITRYGYDQKGRVASETRTIDNVDYVTGYDYDSGGRLASVTYPSGSVVSYTRDAAGHISQIDVSKDGVTRTVVSQVVYQPFDGVQSFVNGAGQAINRGYDLDGRTTSYSLRGQPQMVTYDAASRITAIWDTSTANNVSSYGYDNLDRLTQFSANATGASQSFGYDAMGNRISQLLNSGGYAYSYSPGANRLVQVSGPGTTQAFSYDANGSQVANGNSQFNYDARGRLVSVNTPLGLVQYKINALGQRVQKITPNDSTIYHYDKGGKLIGERAGQSTVDYVYLEDLPVAILK